MRSVFQVIWVWCSIPVKSMKLESEHLILRPYEVEYAPTFYRWFYSGDFDEYFRYYGDTFVMEQFRQFPLNTGVRLYCAFDKTTGNLVGAGGFYNTNETNRNCYLLVALEPEVRHLGYTAEILKLIGYLVFEVKHFHKVMFEVLASNKRLNSLCEKAGFLLEGTKKDSCWLNGAYVDENVYSLLEDKYRQLYGKIGG